MEMIGIKQALGIANGKAQHINIINNKVTTLWD